MHDRLLAAAAAAILLIAPVSVSAQYGDGYGGGGRRGGGYCDQLRRACENKDALGEGGQGNCRRFREECGGGDRESGYRERGGGYGGGREYGFDESEYLRCNPDVLRAVRRGQMESGAVHYQTFGRRERRRLSC